MKSRSLLFLPRTLVVCVAPLLAGASAHASVVSTRESQNPNVWTLPSGANLLTGATVTTSGTLTDHGPTEGTSTNLAVLTDGTVGIEAGTDHGASVGPANGTSITYALDLTGHPTGRDITSFDSYCAWDNSGRDNQNYMLQYSTVANPGTFITISTVNVQTQADRSTHTRLTDDTGFLATGVHSVRLIFDRQENSWVGYREFVLQDAPMVVSVDNTSRNDNAWPALVGPNLLNGTTATPATANTHENSSPNWATLTDGSLGTADTAGNAQSVTPNNSDSVVFPLDLVAKPEGYDITSFESYSAWGSSGRDDQRYTLEYSTVGAPTTFIPITEVFNHTEWTGSFDSGRKATRTRVTANGGKLALGVAAIRVTFHDQENTYTGFREFILRDTPPPTTIVTESNATNIWTLPTGTNLLSNELIKTPPFAENTNHGNNDITNSDWSVLTDGSTGSAGIQLQSVAPLNDTSVIFPLDLSTNFKGYDLKSLDTYCAWGDSGRDDQNYSVSYSTAEFPEVFIPLHTVSNKTFSPDNSTHSRIAANSGFLANNVAALKFDFAGQENGWTGFREFIALGKAAALADPLTWAGLGGSGGNANWISGSDTNWKENGVTKAFNSIAPLVFNNTGINPNISVAANVTAASLSFSNDTSHPYTFSGAELTVTNDVALTGAGNATFTKPLKAAGLEVSGSGNLTLSVDNTLPGSATVSNGTLNVATDYGLGTSSLSLSGGTVKLTSTTPTLNSLAGTGGSIVLGNPANGGDSELYVGSSTTTSYAGSIANASGTAIGSLTKVGAGTLTLSGANTYTGNTVVSEGELKLGKQSSLPTPWNASKISIYGISVLSLRMGGTGEFVSGDIATIQNVGFDTGASPTFAFDTTSGNALISHSLTTPVRLEKQGINTLKLTGSNTFSGGITIAQGALELAKTGGGAITSDVTVGDVTFDAYLNFAADNQFGPNSLLKFRIGNGAVNGKVQLRGTSQTIAGLVSESTDRLAVVQNDDSVAPGYTTAPGAATLTINTAADSFHSFRGMIRNGAGASLSLVKNGLGTQEFVNSLDGYSFDGVTSVNQGKLRFAFVPGNTGYGSNVTIASGASLEFHAVNGDHNFDRNISGAGHVLANGTNAIRFSDNNNSWTGGTTVGYVSDGTEETLYKGFLALVGNGSAGAGTALGQNSAGGAMIPSNLINVENGATLALDGIAPLGNSTMLPQFAPSVRISEKSELYGSSVSFVPNLTLDGGKVRITSGSDAGSFNTNLAFVGTVTVGGTSTIAAQIVNATDASGPFNNASLGSIGQPGTTFLVADVATGTDLQIGAILRNIKDTPSPLTKTGAGTLALEGVNTYTGDTTVTAGELLVNGTSIANNGKVVLNGGKLGITAGANETIGALYFGAVQQDPGTYGSSDSDATHKDNTRFSGTGIVTVSSNLLVTYEQWSQVIPNAADRDRTDDADGDGFNNLQEFLFGTSPIANTGSLSTFEKSGNNLIIRWSQRAAGTYTLKESTTLENPWTTSTIIPTNAGDQTGQYSGEYVRKEAIIPIDSARKFVRVEASE